jgi:3',5'-cyclic AMP phosphodiesterase CpdA
LGKLANSVLVAQITDTHVGFDAEAGDEEFNYLRFVGAVDHLLGQPVQPDLLVISGDIADKGAHASYERIKRLIARIPFPVHLMAGNHDDREEMLAAFPDCPISEGFVQYAIEVNGLRILCLDTLEHGRHGGAFCETRAAWLARELEEHRDVPTMLMMHHPPIIAGIEWMDPRPHEPWLHRFEEAIAGHDQIVMIACGHLHRSVCSTFGGRPLSITPAVAPAVTLDMRPMDFHHADERGIVDAEPPSYALHYWHHGMMVTHFQPAGDWLRLARYSENLVPMMERLDAEKR